MVRGSHLAVLTVVGSLLSANWAAHAEPRIPSLAEMAKTILALPGKAEAQPAEVHPAADSAESPTEAPAKLPTDQADDTAEAASGGEQSLQSRIQAIPPEWYVRDDYAAAMKEATEDRKMLMIYFYDRTPNSAQRAFEVETLANLEIQEKLKRYVFVKLPRDTKIRSGGKSIMLLKHPAFAEMLGREGVAVIDLVHERAEYYGHVVSTFPFSTGKYYRKNAMSVVLDLPPGTLTQRTMIFAVRVHPERPGSTQGQLHATLSEEAKKHSHYQASIQVQGHHSWDSRFHRINSKLPNGVLAQEVVAESWPNEHLVEACLDCVHSWRQSPGHWGAVRSRQPLFGYDIKRGRNGIWYATGIFGRR